MRSLPLLADPDWHTAPTYTATLGDEVGDLCRQVGYGPYPEQQILLDDTFALARGGRSAAFEVAAICARQNLKTGFIKQAALGWLFLTEQELVVWSAHEFATAEEALRDLQVIIDSSSMLSRRVKRIYEGNNKPSIELMDGRRLVFRARTGGGGRGLTGDKVILDEAFALKPEHMGALLPTLLAVDDPQVVYGSSAGMLASGILRRIRDRGRAGDARLAYAEWCSERRPCGSDLCTHLPGVPGCALDDRELWAQANPVHARRDPALTAVAALRRALTPEEFARECLGWWEDPADGGDGDFVGAESWRWSADPGSAVVGQPSLGVALSVDLRSASIGVAGENQHGRLHLEVVEAHALQEVWDVQAGGWRAGTPGLVGALARLSRVHGAQVVLDEKGPAADLLLKPLVEAGVRVHVATADEVVEACAKVVDAVESHGAAHLDDPALTASAVGAWRKPIGDRFGLARRKSDTCEVESVVMAAHGVTVGAGGFNIW